MALQYAPRTFLRQTSNELLQACFGRIGVLQDLPWNELPNHHIDVIYDGWQSLPDAERLEVERTFEEAEALASEAGIKTIIDEGTFHGLDLASELQHLQNYRDKAMHVAIVHPRVFEVAGQINHAHSLSRRYWQRRVGMPQTQPIVTPDAIGRFKNAISAYFRQNEGRGHRCTVDNYRRMDRHHYFFAYPDNYADTYLGHDEDGHFIRRAQRPAFEIVFLYDPIDGTLDIYAQGGKVVHESLQTIFCRTLLDQELPDSSPLGHPYELNGLKVRDFLHRTRQTDPEDGIEEVQIRKLRLSVMGGANRKITIDVDPNGGPSAIYDTIDHLLNRENLPDALFNITLAQFHFRFVHTGQGRQKSLTFEISHPNGSNLKSCRREDHRQIAEKYLRRWGIDRA